MIAALDATPLILSSGGLQRYVSQLSLAMAAEFPEDKYVLLSDQPFEVPPGAPPNLSGGSPGGSSRWWLRGVREAIRAAGAQIFHGTNFEVPYLGRTPSILTIHDLSPWRDRRWHEGANRVRSRTPWLIRLGRASRILTMSEAVRQEVVSYFGVDERKIKAIPLAAASFFQPLPPATSPPPYFFYAGTIEPRKNIPALIEAWRETRGETGADLVIAGRTRPDSVPLEPQSGLKLLGEVSDYALPRLLADALALVYPTHYEGFGLPVLEAMQCGCPVITSNDPAVREVAGGAAVHAGSVREIADAMRAVAANKDLRDRMRADGLARAAQFSWQRTARATRALYQEIAS